MQLVAVKRAYLMILVSWLTLLPALAQTDEQNCLNSQNDDEVMKSCTAVIESGQARPEVLAKAYNKRGLVYTSKRGFELANRNYDLVKDFDTKAIADFTKAISKIGRAHV